ncbi:MAG: F0F1 ATP synthase subunit B [Acutalibacteraceae bacterium]
MQTLDVISVNLWDIVVSLCNLAILFLILKKFLYKPVRKMLQQRQKSVDDKYAQAQEALSKAESDKAEYEKKLGLAKSDAQAIIKKATDTADERSKEIVSSAREEASLIINRAQSAAELEKKKAEQEIKGEIVSVSTLLAEKLLEREISEDDHKAMIDSFIEEIGGGDGKED